MAKKACALLGKIHDGDVTAIDIFTPEDPSHENNAGRILVATAGKDRTIQILECKIADDEDVLFRTVQTIKDMKTSIASLQFAYRNMNDKASLKLIASGQSELVQFYTMNMVRSCDRSNALIL